MNDKKEHMMEPSMRSFKGKRDMGQYKNEVEEPSIPSHGHQEAGMGVHDFKGQAQDIAYGQASEQGCKADSKRMSAQFKNYHWDSDTGGASGY
jgi:hypothetical protein